MALSANYHIHTYRCKHAEGDCRDYCEQAVAQGMETVGFADHTPLPDGRWPEVRMEMHELDGYVRSVRQAGREFPQLRVLLGMEVEILPQYVEFYEQELLGKRQFDYLIGSVHYIPVRARWQHVWQKARGPEVIRAYAELAVATIESGLVSCVAHPDLLGVIEEDWNVDYADAAREVCAAAAAARVPLEINARGIRNGLIARTDGTERYRYPWTPFWEVAADEGASVVIGSDAHAPDEVAAGEQEIRTLIAELGLREVDIFEEER